MTEEVTGKNEPDVADDAVIAVNLSKIRTAQDAAASHHASLRAVLKSAEAKGLHLKAAKRALQIAKSGETDAWLEENQAVAQYLKILRHGITSQQLEMFQTMETLAPIDEKAALDGRTAGLMGGIEQDNPHELSTPAGQAWLREFRQALTERELVLSMEPDAEQAEKLITAEHADAAEDEGANFDDEFEEEAVA